MTVQIVMEGKVRCATCPCLSELFSHIWWMGISPLAKFEVGLTGESSSRASLFNDLLFSKVIQQISDNIFAQIWTWQHWGQNGLLGCSVGNSHLKQQQGERFDRRIIREQVILGKTSNGPGLEMVIRPTPNDWASTVIAAWKHSRFSRQRYPTSCGLKLITVRNVEGIGLSVGGVRVYGFLFLVCFVGILFHRQDLQE